MKTEKIKVGEVVVDSGTLIIADPCNIMHGSYPELFGENWSEFCQNNEPDYFEKGFQVKKNNIGAELAIDIRPGGDGRYPVYVEKNRAGFLRIIIEIDESS